MERATTTKTSAVHFLRFQLNQDQVSAVGANQNIIFGVNHPKYSVDPLTLPISTRNSLAGDIIFDK
jgi:hypothetical protein